MNYHNITHDDMLNGDGLRVVLWVAGCSHHCKGCQNPQTWDSSSGIKFDDSAKDEIFADLSKEYIDGITFSGGDPLNENNISTVFSLVKDVKSNFPKKSIWLYTGYTFEQIMNESTSIRKQIIQNIEVLVDGRYEESIRDTKLRWKGSSNQRVINVKATLSETNLTRTPILWCPEY